MSNNIPTDRLVIKNKTFLIKKAIDDEGCLGCTNFNEHNEYLCNEVYAHAEKVIKDENHTRCGLGTNVLIEDTPEAIMQYLELKLNHTEGEEDA